MDVHSKNKLTQNSVTLVKEVDFDRIKEALIFLQALPESIVLSICNINGNVERIQKLLVELKKSPNPNVFQNFLLALKHSGYSYLINLLSSTFSDGQPFFNNEQNNNQNALASPGGSFYSSKLGHMVQPAVFYHDISPNHASHHNSPNSFEQGKFHSQPEQMIISQDSESFMEVDSLNDSSQGTIADCSVVKSVKVQTASELIVSEENYSMTSKIKGYCLIINNVVFNGGPTDYDLMEKRDGSNHDANILSILYEQLGYEIHLHHNLKARDGNGSMYEVIKAFSKFSGHLYVDSAVVIILSHGKEGDLIYGIDAESIGMERILKFFNNENCPNLKNKPKMFFVQACRGGELDRGVPGNCVHDSPAGPICSPQTVSLTRRDSMEDKIPRISSWSDMMIAYSTCPGYVSIRNIALGSWFVQALVRIFMARAHNTHIQDMMNLVSYEIKNKFETVHGEKQSVEIIYRSWTKKLNFNPGRYSS